MFTHRRLTHGWEYYRELNFDPNNKDHIFFIRDKIKQFNENLQCSFISTPSLTMMIALGAAAIGFTPWLISPAICAVLAALVHDSRKIFLNRLNELFEIYRWSVSSQLLNENSTGNLDYANELIVTIAPFLVDPKELYQWAEEISRKPIALETIKHTNKQFLDCLINNSLFAVNFNQEARAIFQIHYADFNVENVRKALNAVFFGRGGTLRDAWPRVVQISMPLLTTDKEVHRLQVDANDMHINVVEGNKDVVRYTQRRK